MILTVFKLHSPKRSCNFENCQNHSYLTNSTQGRAISYTNCYHYYYYYCYLRQLSILLQLPNNIIVVHYQTISRVHLLKTSIRPWFEWSKKSNQHEEAIQSHITIISSLAFQKNRKDKMIWLLMNVNTATTTAP